MHNVIIRKALLEELANLLNFEQGIIEYERHMVPDMMMEHFNYYDLKELIESENSEVLVAEVDGRLIASGYAKLKKSLNYLTHEYHSFLGFMFVSPEFRGKGINGKIIDQLTTWSKEKGATVLNLTVFSQNESGIRAYEKIGFDKSVIEMRKDIQ
jgi:GNAT superfamily N-acetyltransferase